MRQNDFWWEKKGEELGRAVWEEFSTYHEKQKTRRIDAEVFYHLYDGLNARGYGGNFLGRLAVFHQRNRTRINVIKSCIDTLVSKLAKNQPRPELATSGANPRIKRNVKKLNQFLNGELQRLNIDKLLPLVLRDALTFGTGVLKVHSKEKRIALDRVPFWEIYVDPVETKFSAPTVMFHSRVTSRAALKTLYPGSKNAVMIDLSEDDKDDTYVDNGLTDTVRVVEAWRLPQEGEPGKWAACVSNGLLDSDDYEEKNFPFVFLHGTKPLLGFWGTGLPEELAELQFKVNKTLDKIDVGLDNNTFPFVLAEKHSDFNPEAMLNNMGNTLWYEGSIPPQFVTMPPFRPEAMNYLQFLIQTMYQQSGVSQSTATGVKQSGVTSAAQQREILDVESERFLTLARDVEQLTMELAEVIVHYAKKLYAENDQYLTFVKSRSFTGEVDWADIDLEETDYFAQVFPISSFPYHPIARRQTINEDLQLGRLTEKQANYLLLYPDREDENALDLSTVELTEKIIETMLETGRYIRPVPNMDLGYAFEYANKRYLLGLIQEMDEQDLENLMLFADECRNQSKIVANEQAQGSQPTTDEPPAETAQEPEQDDADLGAADIAK